MRGFSGMGRVGGLGGAGFGMVDLDWLGRDLGTYIFLLMYADGEEMQRFNVQTTFIVLLSFMVLSV
jgi:hypothetical protein